MKHLIAVFTLCLFFSFVNGQRVFPPNKDFVIAGNQVWDLKNGGIIAFDLNSGKQTYKTLKTNFIATQLAKDIQGDIIVSSGTNGLMKLNKLTLAWETVSVKHFERDYGFIFNSLGNCFQVVKTGLLDNQTGQIFIPGKKYCSSEWRSRGGSFAGWEKDDVSYFMDKNDNLWFNVSYGEWGSDMFVFNTIKHQFIKLNGEYVHLIRDVFECDKRIYCYGDGIRNKPYTQFAFYLGLSLTPNDSLGQGLTSHTIYNTLNNKGHDDMMKAQKSMYPDDYIGPAAYNPMDRRIYFCCKYGLFKGDPEKSLSDISLWEKIGIFKLQGIDIKPPISGRIGIPGLTEKIISDDYDVAVPYEVTKIAFTNDGKLVFLSLNDGLGVFDGQKITMLDKTTSN